MKIGKFSSNIRQYEKILGRFEHRYNKRSNVQLYRIKYHIDYFNKKVSNILLHSINKLIISIICLKGFV